MTGVLNRRAFDLSQHFAVGIVDLDSLKYLNDTYSHELGNSYLCTLARFLEETFDDVYRLGGDEFAVTGDSLISLISKLTDLQAKLQFFSFGVDTTLVRADAQLRRNKAKRELNGERASRGECPPWQVAA